MPPNNGEQTPRKHKGRVTLTSRAPFVTKLVAGLDLDGTDIDDILRFGKKWWAWRDEWDIARRPRGLFGNCLLRRDEADAALRRELAAMANGGAQ